MRSGTEDFSLFYKTYSMVEHQSHNFIHLQKYAFHCDCQIPNMYNKTSVDILIADMYNDTYTKQKSIQH